MNTLMQNYSPFPLAFERGDGCHLYTKKGEKYLDLMSGVAVCSLGHNHPKLTKAISRQAGKLLHVSNWYQIPEQQALADALSKLTGYDACFFCNSGAEANEAALKLARKATKRTGFISFDHSFHGRTLGALSVTGKESIRKDFLPLVPGAVIVPWEDEKALEVELKKGKTAAVIFEFVQGEGGILPMTSAFAKKLFALAKKYGALTIADEVQTGAGRTGSFLAGEGYGLTADITTMAKGLGGGVPIGAMLAKTKVASAFTVGAHGSTFGGNPLCTVAALTVTSEVGKAAFLKRVRDNGAYLLKALTELQWTFPALITAVRGRGLMVGIEMVTPELRASVITALQEKKILVIGAGEKVVRCVPPLIVTRKELTLFVTALRASLTHLA